MCELHVHQLLINAQQHRVFVGLLAVTKHSDTMRALVPGRKGCV